MARHIPLKRLSARRLGSNRSNTRLSGRLRSNPLPEDSSYGGIAPQEINVDELGMLESVLRKALTSGGWVDKPRADRFKKALPFLIAQGDPVFRQTASAKMGARDLALAILGYDEGGVPPTGAPPTPDGKEVAVQGLIATIERLRERADVEPAVQPGSSTEGGSASPPGGKTPPISNLTIEEKGVIKLVRTQAAYKAWLASRGAKLTSGDLRWLQSYLGTLKKTGWRLTAQQQILMRLSQEDYFRPIEATRQEAKVSLSVPSFAPGDDEVNEAPEDEDEYDEDDEDEDDESDQNDSRTSGSGPGAKSAQKAKDLMAKWRGKDFKVMPRPLEKIPGIQQRHEAKLARDEGSGRGMLNTRRVMTGTNPAFPYLPNDVAEAYETLYSMATKAEPPTTTAHFNRGQKNRPQDVLVYLLTKDHAVGTRGRKVPAGAVEVYNKGAHIATFYAGPKAYSGTIKAARRFAARLVGVDVGTTITFKNYKASRANSRVMFAMEGNQTIDTLIPSRRELEATLAGQPGETQNADFSQMFTGAGGLAQAKNNPRRNQRGGQMGNYRGVKYQAGPQGYQIKSGPNRGRTYLFKDKGQLAKLAMLEDIDN